MERFAFILHPIDSSDFTRKFPFAARFPEPMLESVMRRVPPFKVSHIEGVRSITGKEIEGWFIGVPLTARQMMELPTPFVTERIVRAGRKAEELGAQIVGLGAFTSVVGDAGVTVDKSLAIPVTTGNTYTVATALQGIEVAADAMEIELETARVAILGASGSIGSACARVLARRGRDLILIGRRLDAVRRLADQVAGECGRRPEVTADVSSGLGKADVVVTVTSAIDTIVRAEDLKPGSVICDVSRPRNVSKAVAEARSDVLVFEGGVVEVPGEPSFGFNFGFPEGTAYACMSETMILAMEGRFEPYSLGRDLDVDRVEEITWLAKKHGFRLTGLRSFERAVTDEQIARIRQNAREARRRPVAEQGAGLAGAGIGVR